MFCTEVPSISEYDFQIKIDNMQKLESIAYGIPVEIAESAEMKTCWKSAIKEL